MLLLADIPENVAILCVVILVVIFIYTLAAKVVDSRRRVKETAEREQTRREVAAYIAEGSMTAEDGRKILGDSDDPMTSARKKIAESVAEGIIDAESAKKTLKALDSGAPPVKA